MNKPTLYVMIGAPGSGKSTVAKKFSDKFNIPIVSRDTIRYSILKDNDSYFAKESLVFNTFMKKVNNYLQNGESLIADATHLNPVSRFKLFRGIHLDKNQYNRVAIVVQTSLNTCLERNAQRSGRQRVPDSAVRTMYNSLILPSKSEQFKDTIIIDESTGENYDDLLHL